MTTTVDLQLLAHRRGHRLYYTKLPLAKSISMRDRSCSIALDTSLAGRAEKERLAHELGHCETGYFYCLSASQEERSRAEHRANKWAYCRLTPLNEIKRVIGEGITEIADLADYFDVTPQFMADAIKYYKDAEGEFFAAE